MGLTCRVLILTFVVGQTRAWAEGGKGGRGGYMYMIKLSEHLCTVDTYTHSTKLTHTHTHTHAHTHAHAHAHTHTHTHTHRFSVPIIMLSLTAGARASRSGQRSVGLAKACNGPLGPLHAHQDHIWAASAGHRAGPRHHKWLIIIFTQVTKGVGFAH